MFYKTSPSTAPCRTAHRRTNSKPMIDLPPPPSSLQSRSNPFTCVQTPSFQLEEEKSLELVTSSPNSSSLGLVNDSTTKLSPLGFHSTFWFSFFSSLLQTSKIKLQESLFKLVFLISLLAFICPLAGIGYHQHSPHSNVPSASLPLSPPLQPLPPPSSSSSPPTPQADSFPLHLTPISTKDVGPLFANVVISSARQQPRSYEFSHLVSDSTLRELGLKPRIESHDQGKPDLVKKSSPVILKEDSIFLDPLKPVSGHQTPESLQVPSTHPSTAISSEKDEIFEKLLNPSEYPISLDEKTTTSEIDTHASRLEPPVEESEENGVQVDSSEPEVTAEKPHEIYVKPPPEAKPAGETNNVGNELSPKRSFLEGEEDFEEEDPEISDDSESPEEMAFQEHVLPSQQSPTFIGGNEEDERSMIALKFQGEESPPKDPDSNDFEVKKEIEIADLKIKKEVSVDLEKTEFETLDPQFNEHPPSSESPLSMMMIPGWKTKELESITQSRLLDHQQEPNLFPEPELVEVMSGRKGLRARHFR